MNYPFLLPLSWLYTWGLERQQVKAQQQPPRKCPVPVISIGNLTVGGTGKTEAVAWVCDQMVKAGLKPAILSRGYRRHSRDPLVVVSDGQTLRADPRAGGDEPYALAQRFLGQAAVVVGRDRFQTGMLAVEQLGCQILILDDGFQRRFQLFRDLEILLMDASDKQALSGRVLPAGPYREPLTAMADADMIIITRSDQVDPQPLEQLIRRTIGQSKPVYHASHKAYQLVDVKTNTVRPVEVLKGQRVVAVSGIAKPQAFINTLEACGAVVCHHQRYPDHFWYRPDQLRQWEKLARRHHAAVVMTTKDMVKVNWPAASSIEAWALAVRFQVQTPSQETPWQTFLQPLAKGPSHL